MTPRLTHRQASVLFLLAQGLTVKQCARRLGLSPATLHDHTQAIQKRLQATNLAHALTIALGEGDIPFPFASGLPPVCPAKPQNCNPWDNSVNRLSRIYGFSKEQHLLFKGRVVQVLWFHFDQAVVKTSGPELWLVPLSELQTPSHAAT